jgi:hypothetical protein
MLPVAPDAATAPARRATSVDHRPPPHHKVHRPGPRRRRGHIAGKIFEELWDAIEDVFD